MNAMARFAYERFSGSAFDREKTNQMFGRWQHSDVLYTFIVRRTGSIVGIVQTGKGFISHFWDSSCNKKLLKDIKKTARLVAV
jgi:hypothetical protein